MMGAVTGSNKPVEILCDLKICLILFILIYSSLFQSYNNESVYTSLCNMSYNCMKHPAEVSPHGHQLWAVSCELRTY
jgi:hypothetical protein